MENEPQIECPLASCTTPLENHEHYKFHLRKGHDLDEWVMAVVWMDMVMSTIVTTMFDVLGDEKAVEVTDEIDRRVTVLRAEVDADQRRN